MLGEPPSVTERRKQLNSTINVLKNALKVIQRDPDITSAGMDGADGELAQELRNMQLHAKANPPPQRPVQQ
jgi:hypothetical protein